MNTTALIAEDEPLLAEALKQELATLWPELQIVATVGDGLAAAERTLALKPAVCFFDIRMPGQSGLDAAQALAEDWPQDEPFPLIVFVTAYDQYALQAFEHGALDYLVKPVSAARLQETVSRLQERVGAARPAAHTEELLQQLAQRLDALQGQGSAQRLRWVRASVGDTLLMIPVQTIDYLKADSKYTLVAYRDDQGRAAEALIRLALKELLALLDPQEFVQVHRAVVVRLGAVHRVHRGENETATLELRQRAETLPVSRTYLHLFREM